MVCVDVKSKLSLCHAHEDVLGSGGKFPFIFILQAVAAGQTPGWAGARVGWLRWQKKRTLNKLLY
jgi:hypothetical protein